MAYDAGNIEYSVGVNTVEAENGAERIERSINKVDAKMSKMAVATKKASGSFANLSRNSGQAGIQIQQLVGQIQGGQSPMLALSQQAADLGIVLGAPLVGAVIGLSASFAGMLLPSLLETENALEKYNEKQKLAQEATNNFIQSTDRASKNNAILTATTKLNREYDLLSQTINNAKNEQTEITKQIGTASETAIGRLQARFTKLNELIDESKEKQKVLSGQIEETFMQGLGEATDQTDEALRGLSSFTDALQTKVETLGMTERGLALYTAEQLGATQADKEAINAKYDIIEAYNAQIDAERELKKAQERLKARVETIGLTPLDEIQARYDTEQDLLKQALERKLITQIEFAEKEKQLTKEKVEAINAYNSQQIKNQQMFSDTQGQMLGALGNVFGTFANAMDTSNKESFEKQKKFAIAQALVNTLLSVSYAMANPWPLNLALAAAAGISGAATVAQINSQQFAGGREMGGPVSANSVYRVGERGPEIFTAGGQNYMIPGEAGQVVNNKDAFGSQQQQQPSVVNLTFNASGSIDKDFEEFVYNNTELFYAAVASSKHQNGEMF